MCARGGVRTRAGDGGRGEGGPARVGRAPPRGNGDRAREGRRRSRDATRGSRPAARLRGSLPPSGEARRGARDDARDSRERYFFPSAPPRLGTRARVARVGGFRARARVRSVAHLAEGLGHVVHGPVRVHDGVLEQPARGLEGQRALVIRLARIVRALVRERAQGEPLRVAAARRGQPRRGAAQGEHRRRAEGARGECDDDVGDDDRGARGCGPRRAPARFWGAARRTRVFVGHLSARKAKRVDASRGTRGSRTQKPRRCRTGAARDASWKPIDADGVFYCVFSFIRSQFRRRGNKRWLVSICIFHAGAHPHRRSRRPQSPSRVACASSCLRVGILRLSLTPPRDVDVDVDIDTTPRRSLAPPFDRSFDRSSPRTTPSRRTHFSAAPPPWRASPPASGARETSSPWRRARRSTPPSSPAPPRASPRTRRWRSRAYPPRREGPSLF